MPLLYSRTSQQQQQNSMVMWKILWNSKRVMRKRQREEKMRCAAAANAADVRTDVAAAATGPTTLRPRAIDLPVHVASA